MTVLVSKKLSLKTASRVSNQQRLAMGERPVGQLPRTQLGIALSPQAFNEYQRDQQTRRIPQSSIDSECLRKAELKRRRKCQARLDTIRSITPNDGVA